MVNRQHSAMFALMLAAPLALVSVTTSSAATLPIPVRAIVRLEASPPRWIILTGHASAMRDGKASTAAKSSELLVAQRAELSLERFTAHGANHDSALIMPYQVVCALPRTAAFTVAEVVRSLRARADALQLPAPIAGDYNRLMATGLAKMLLRSGCPPQRTLHFNATIATRYFHMDNSTTLDRPCQGSGSEMIGAMQAGWEEVVGIEQDSEYCEIARRRIEYWDSQKAKTPAQVKQPQEQELVMA